MRHRRSFSAYRWGMMVALAICVGPTARGAEPQESRRPLWSYVGLSVSSFTPASARTRDRFGGTWLSVGPKYCGSIREREKDIQPGLSLLSQSHHGNDITLVQAGGSYRQTFTRRSGVLPYAGVKAYATYVRVNVPAEGGKTTRLTVGGGPFAGVALGQHVTLEARYLFLPKAAGYNFSGAEIEAAAHF